MCGHLRTNFYEPLVRSKKKFVDYLRTPETEDQTKNVNKILLRSVSHSCA